MAEPPPPAPAPEPPLTDLVRLIGRLPFDAIEPRPGTPAGPAAPSPLHLVRPEPDTRGDPLPPLPLGWRVGHVLVWLLACLAAAVLLGGVIWVVATYWLTLFLVLGSLALLFLLVSLFALLLLAFDETVWDE